ncbi:MAG: peptidase T [Lachnospiraceae bacterium]|nr:peptidase T [Lachnospiraceae bacterium]
MTEYRDELLERFLRYVKVYTTSEDDVENIPSTTRQFDLARILENELKELGLQQVKVSDNCYVTAVLPASEGMENHKVVGLIAHMDTAPDYSGENVNPIIHENYDGKDITLGDSGKVITVKDFPELEKLAGRTLITADGTTLLGADDKAGVAEIMTTASYFIKHPEVKHGEIHICFTPDEEVGRGPDKFDVEGFAADYAYTVDGDSEDEVAYENFNAASAIIEIDGVNVHPREAKDIMVNAALIATEIAQALPADETPSNTEGRQGFYHLIEMGGDVAHAKLAYILRDHDKDSFANRKDVVESICKKMAAAYPTANITCTIKDSYENMLVIMEKHPEVIKLAKDAIESVGLNPISRPIRGGTDGAQLSFKGLPCPNLGTGGYGFHGPYEHVSLEGMETVVKELIYIGTHPIQ